MLNYGWRSSFWVSAILGLIIGVIWYVAARDVPEEHPFVSQTELAYIQQSRDAQPRADLPTSPQPGSLRGKWGLVLNQNVLAITVSYFCFGYVAWIFFSWFYIYLARVRGLDLKTSAVYSTLPPLAIVVCSFAGGAISDAITKSFGRRAGRCGLACAALILATIFLVVGSRVASAGLASVVLSGGVGALYLAQSSYWSVTADIGGKSAGLVSGFMNMGAQFGGALTAWLTPVIAQHYGWTSSFLVAAILSAVGSMAWLLVKPDRPLAELART
jgi:MFS transporter, ACS family, glucarate transporter